LESTGYTPDEAKHLAEQMVRVAMQRLVLLVADEDQTVSFDVRSFQELMAGRALATQGDSDAVRHNLKATACSPHWRNAWLFAAGLLFTQGDTTRALVIEVVEQCDSDGHWPGWLYPAGPELAAQLLEDSVAADRPNDQRRLIDVVLRCLSGPMIEDPRTVARGLTTAAKRTASRATIRNAIKDALAGTPANHAIAATILYYGSLGPWIAGQPHDLRQYADMWTGRRLEGTEVRLSALLRPSLTAWADGETGTAATRLKDALPGLNDLVLVRDSVGNLLPVGAFKPLGADLLDALSDPDCEELLSICLGELEPGEWTARSLLARSAWSIIAKKPVSQRLQSR
jgi:hypothetical protein